MKNNRFLRELRSYIRLLIEENEFTFAQGTTYMALMDFENYQDVDSQIKLFNLVYDSLRQERDRDPRLRDFILKNSEKIIEASKSDALVPGMVSEMLDRMGFMNTINVIKDVALDALKMFKKRATNPKTSREQLVRNQNFLENYDEIVDFWKNKMENDRLYISKFSEIFFKEISTVSRVKPGLVVVIPAYRNYLSANMIIHN